MTRQLQSKYKGNDLMLTTATARDVDAINLEKAEFLAGYTHRQLVVDDLAISLIKI